MASGARLWHKRTMEAELDLDQASRETLLEIIAELRQRVESLEARLSGGGPGAGMPGHKPAARRKKPAAEKKPRKKRQHGFARPRMEPAGRVVHAPESCPECHTALTGGWAQRTREIIDIPAVPAEVTEHVFIARICPLCRKRRLPRDPLKGLAAGRQPLGGQPRIQYGAGSGKPDSDPAGRGAAAGKDNPMVSANVSSVETERWGHRPGRPSGCPAGRAGSERVAGAYPFQPGGPR